MGTLDLYGDFSLQTKSLNYIYDEKTRWVFSLSQGKVNFKREIIICPDLYLPRQKIINGFDSKLLLLTIQRLLLKSKSTAMIWHLLEPRSLN